MRVNFHLIALRLAKLPGQQSVPRHRHTDTPTHRHTDALTHLHIKTPHKMKHCNICESDGVTLRVSPKTHERKHSEQERACGQCWEAHLSLQVEEKNKSSEIECMFCTSEIGEADFKSLAREGTKYR
jgi:hypothetical protein